MRYTFKDFKTEYPDDEACLLAVLGNRYGNVCRRCGTVGVKWYKISGRKAFACSSCRAHCYPLADTIFRKSETSLWNWFYAIYLFSVAKNGVSAKELQRHLGVTYKTAWRMAKQIRLLMEQDDTHMLYGEVEADEAYIGGVKPPKQRFDNKMTVMGVVERDGQAKAVVARQPSQEAIRKLVEDNVAWGTNIYTDESKMYNKLDRTAYFHEYVSHGKKEYVRGKVHTNTLEGLWGNMKRSIDGTYHVISPKYLQSYVNEFLFRYNHRHVPVCPVLLERAATLS